MLSRATSIDLKPSHVRALLQPKYSIIPSTLDVVELDQLLSKERNWITPYDDLNEKYFPFRDCEVDALLDAVRKSNFIRSISYNFRTTEYFIHFSSDDVLVGFTYNVSEKKSDPDTNTAGWVHK
jgi:hypothetical protein